MELDDKTYTGMCKLIKDKSDNEKYIDIVIGNLSAMITEQTNKIWDLEHKNKSLEEKIAYYQERYEKEGAE